MASTVIVGSGVMGASVAYHLACRGHRDVLVLDRGPAPGAGSTARATGGFRAQYATPINVRLSLLAREKILAFRSATGADPGYRTVGYLWLAETADQLETLRACQRMQHAEGLVEALELDHDRIGWINPAIDRSGMAGAVFCPTDGYIRPLEILRGYLQAATRLGVRFEWDTPALGLERDPDGVARAVRTPRGSVPADHVVNAAGAWAGAFGRACGLEVPVVPLRRQVALTVPTDALPVGMPMTIFVGDGFHLRVRDGRVLLLKPSPGVPGAPFDETVDPAWLDEIAATARVRVPPLAAVPLDRARSWAGLYEMSPDKHALLGPHPACPNYFLINGSSGHGVMHAPALGHLLAEIILDGRATTLDVRCLRPGRFAEGEPNPVSELL
jgi:sarcosine oxidase subunit beta